MLVDLDIFGVLVLCVFFLMRYLAIRFLIHDHIENYKAFKAFNENNQSNNIDGDVREMLSKKMMEIYGVFGADKSLYRPILHIPLIGEIVYLIHSFRGKYIEKKVIAVEGKKLNNIRPSYGGIG